METLIPSFITGIVTMTGSILTFIATNKKNKMEQDETHKRQLEQLRDSIEKKMDADKDTTSGVVALYDDNMDVVEGCKEYIKK